MAADCIIEIQSWKPLIASEGKTYLTKGIFKDDSYNLLVTDLCNTWEENLNEQQILQRSKELNPYIEVTCYVILQKLSQILNTAPFNTTCSNDSNELTIFVNGPLRDDVPQYHWKFNLTKTPSLIFKHHLVNPLLSMTVELLRQQKELIKTINKKDKEIQDYKENGAVISRKHLETTPFDEYVFNNEMTLTKGFKLSALYPMEHFHTSEWEELYKNIYLCCINNKDAGTLLTQDHTVANTSNIVVSPGHKRPHDHSLPSKDIEEVRRKELKKQLEDSLAKNKKKKKKLM